MEGTLAEGDIIEVTIEGSQVEVGRSSNEVTKVVIKNRDGEDVTSNYDVKHESGILRVVDVGY